MTNKIIICFDGTTNLPGDAKQEREWFGLDEVNRRKLGLTFLKEKHIDKKKLTAEDGSYQIETSDVDIKPNHKGVSHRQDRWGPIAHFTLGVRDVRMKQLGKNSAQPVLIHESVGERIRDIIAYRPKSLKGVEHFKVAHNGTVQADQHSGLTPYI